MLINSLIAKHYGPAALGIFNLVFAIYIFQSQVATLGVQYSILRYISEVDDNPAIGTILCSALVVTEIVSLIIVTVTWFLSLTIGSNIYSEAVVKGVAVMLPGLWCFSINKVLLNALNGLQHNRMLAVFTTFDI